MSVDPAHCRECQGKFGAGPVCAVCDSLHKLGVWLRSPRCPAGVGRSSVERVREVQRSLLEEAEAYWAANLGTESVPGGLKGKASSPIPPPRASGGEGKGGRASGSGASRERVVREELPPPVDNQASKSPLSERHHREKVRHHHRHRHHRTRSRSRRGEKQKKRSVSRSPLVRPPLPAPGTSPRIKKDREEGSRGVRDPSRSPFVEVKEEVDYGEDDEEEEEESEEPRVEASPERPSPPRRPRPPSRSPQARGRWEGPIPAGHRRTGTTEERRPLDRAPAKKKKKKNKGKAKKERQKQWVRENRRRY